MVLSAPPADAAPGEGWTKPFTLALTLSQGAVLLRVENAVDARLGELVRELWAAYPELAILLSPEATMSLAEGSTFVLVPSLRDAEWLNLNRPVFARRGLRCVLWCDAETTRLLPELAPDFCDWISHSRPCPPAASRDICSLVAASYRLLQAGAPRPELLAALLDLERTAVGKAAQLLRLGQSEQEVLAALSGPGESATPFPSARTRGHEPCCAVGEAPVAVRSWPFVPGAALELGAPSFVGRVQAIAQIRASLALGQPVQLLGERRMGKTSLLNQVPQWLPEGLPWVMLSGQGHCGSSEAELVRCLAEKLGRGDIAQAVRGARGAILSVADDVERKPGLSGGLSAADALEALAPCALLLDEAEALGQEGHAFSEGFFDQCRALGQAHRSLLVCASCSDIDGQFQELGLTSRFLNDSRRVWVGQLEADAREELLGLAPELTRVQRDAVLEQTGGFGLGIQWMGDAILRGMDVQEAADRLRLELERVFGVWWRRCSGGEQRLLRSAARGVARGTVTSGERRSLRALVARGVVEETGDAFVLPGRAWCEFVGEQ